LRLAIIVAVLAGLAVATQTSLTSGAQRMIGPVMVVAISGLTTGVTGLAVALFMTKPELTSRAVGYSLASGVLGAFIVGAIAFSAGQGGVARALSLVVAAQLLFGLLFDALGLFGAGSELSLPKVLGVVLILVGGVLVVRY
jgi:transporter family-2 protein